MDHFEPLQHNRPAEPENSEDRIIETVPCGSEARQRSRLDPDETVVELRRRLDEARRDGSSFTAVACGAPGSGKSTILRRFVEHVPEANVLWATCEPDEAHLEFAMLGQLLAGLDVPPESPLSAARRTTDNQLEPLLAGAALIELLDADSHDNVVIVIDDAHFADLRSVRALVFALRRLGRNPLVTCLSVDPAEQQRLPGSLRRLLTERALHVTIEPLDMAAIARLAADRGVAPLGQPALQRLADHSRGNPLQVEALLQELSADEIRDTTKVLRAPASYAEITTQRLSRCSDEALALAETLAIMGDGTSLRLAAQVAGLDRPSGAFDELCAAGIFTDGDLERLEFDHPMTRSAVFHATSTARRRRLHAAASELLEATDSLAALEHRIAGTLTIDDDLAEAVLIQADRDAAVGSWTTATARYRAAASLAGPGSVHTERATLGMVDCLALSGDRTGLAAAEVTISAFDTSALRAYGLGRIRGLTGAWDEAATRFAEAWELLDDQSRPELAARICAESARTAIVGGHSAPALQWLDRAASYPTSDAQLQQDQLAMWGLAMGIGGRAGEALALLAGAPEPSDIPTAVELDQLFGRGMLRLWSGDADGAHDDLARVAKATRGRGPVHAYLYACQYLADAAYRVGDWDEAVVTAEDGAATAEDLGNAWALPMLHAVGSYALAQRGDFAAAEAHLDAAETGIISAHDIPNRLWVALGRARLAEARRDPSGVVAALEPMAALADLDGVREPGIQPWQPTFVTALIDIGETARAEALLEAVLPLASERGLHVVSAELERERARLIAPADPDGALAALETAGELLDEAGHRPFERARLDLVHAQLLAAVGRVDDATDRLHRALTEFTTLGASPWTDEATALLERLQGGGADTRSRPNRLTPHERRVARLVAAGMTNKQVAAELVISTRTVGYHLENIYAKLGVHSRVQMANMLDDADAD